MKKIVKEGRPKEVVEFECKCGCVFESNEYTDKLTPLSSNSFLAVISHADTHNDICPECGELCIKII